MKFWTQLVIEVAREFVCFQIPKNCIMPMSFIFWMRNYLFHKNFYFRGNGFSHCFLLSAALHCSLPSQFVCSQLFWVITNSVHCLQVHNKCLLLFPLHLPPLFLLDNLAWDRPPSSPWLWHALSDPRRQVQASFRSRWKGLQLLPSFFLSSSFLAPFIQSLFTNSPFVLILFLNFCL